MRGGYFRLARVESTLPLEHAGTASDSPSALSLYFVLFDCRLSASWRLVTIPSQFLKTSRAAPLILLLVVLGLYILLPRFSAFQSPKLESPVVEDTLESPVWTTTSFQEDKMVAPAAGAALKHLKMNPKEAHQSTIIFLHGLGDSGNGWLPVAKQFWSQLPNTKWILPHAPTMPVTINNGYRMPSWYDIAPLEHLTDSKREDEAGIHATIAAVDKLIQAEVDSGIPEHKVIVAGFSQGGAVSAYLGLTTSRKLAGIGCLSTYVPLNHNFPSALSPTAKDLPIFWGHGTDDPVVRYKFGEQSIELLKKLGFPPVSKGQAFARPGLRFESYPGMQHSSCPEEMRDLLEWLKGALE